MHKSIFRFSISFVLLLAVGLLISCGGTDSKSKNTSSSTSTSTTTSEAAKSDASSTSDSDEEVSDAIASSETDTVQLDPPKGKGEVKEVDSDSDDKEEEEDTKAKKTASASKSDSGTSTQKEVAEKVVEETKALAGKNGWSRMDTDPVANEKPKAPASTTKTTTDDDIMEWAGGKSAVATEDKNTRPAPPATKPKVEEVKEKVEQVAKPPKPELTDPLKPFFNATDAFMKKYVSGGLVSYSSVNKSELDALLKSIETMDLSKANNTGKQAFYINAYNICVIKNVLDNNIPASPLDDGNFFKAAKFNVASRTLSLDALEKQVLMKLKNDARFHFALVCAAKGCPKIENFAYRPERLGKVLDGQTKKAMDDPNFIRVNKKKKKVEISKIFEWYAGDFTQGGQTILGYINKYRTEKIPDNYEVGYYEYDWALNKR